MLWALCTFVPSCLGGDRLVSQQSGPNGSLRVLQL
jgi:hypothetical protein